MKQLSIFIDESGDFGEYNGITEYYVISFVFHNQTEDISGMVERLDNSLKDVSDKKFAIHTIPLIRREEMYIDMSPNERRAILRKLFFFAKSAPISFKTFIFSKKNFKTFKQLYGHISREMDRFFFEHKDTFSKFDEIIIYYDNGQQTITNLIHAVVAINFDNYDIRKVMPVDYRLFQVADMLCSFAVINERAKKRGLSSSEKCVLHSYSDFKKDFLKDLLLKELK